MNKKELLSYLLTFDGKNYYLNPRNDKVYTETYKQELTFNLTNFVPIGNILLLNLATYIMDSSNSVILRIIYIFLGILASGYVGERLARKEKGNEFQEFHFETLFRKEEFLLILSRNVYGKLCVGVICTCFALYQVSIFLKSGSYTPYLLTVMSTFIAYLSFVQSRLFKQIQLYRSLKLSK